MSFIIKGGGGDSSYKIARSLRFNSADTPKLTNTCVAVPTNDKMFTQSFWFKRGAMALLQSIVGPLDDIRISADDTFSVVGAGGVTIYRYSNQKFRDPTAWYHFVLKWDTANATAADRLRVYVNGAEITSWFTNNAVGLNYQHLANKASTVRYISTYNGANWHADGYFAEYYHIDGQALTPSSFGETDALTGAWNPKAYAGAYGANGFYLPFSDNTNTTPAYIGKDFSGTNILSGQTCTTNSTTALTAITGTVQPQLNQIVTGAHFAAGTYLTAVAGVSGAWTATLSTAATGTGTSQSVTFTGNNWLPANISVAAGTGNDSLTDTPTDFSDGNVHGNFCTWSPINKHAAATCILSNGNLQARGSSAANTYHVIGTQQIPAGKYYFEYTADAGTYDVAYDGVGVCDATFASAGNIAGDVAHTSAGVWTYQQNGNKKTGATLTAFGSTYTTNDIIGVAVDATDPTSVKVWWSKNGTWQASGVPDTGTSPAYTITTGPVWPMAKFVSNATGSFVNFGQRPFASTANATAFKAICQHNISTPTIVNPKKYVHVGNRTGTGAAGSRTGVPFQPNIIQNKPRNATGNLANPITTSIRGTGKYRSTYTNGEVTDAQAITAFNADGYSFGTAAVLNTNAIAYWDGAWKTDPANGIEVITWTGDNGATKAITHTLGKKPGMCFAFTLGAGATLPYLWFKGFASDAHFMKDSAGYMAAEVNTNSPFSAFGTTTITVTNNATNNLNANAVEHMAILCADGPLWAGGTVVGNSSVDGAVIYCGFKPALISVHENTNQEWASISAPDDYNGSASQKSNPLWATYGSQARSGTFMDILSNGAKLKSTAFTAANTKYWMAFAEQAGKYGRAV